MTTTIDVANQYVSLCRVGKNAEALAPLFSDDAVSVEAMAMPGASQEAHGMAAIQAKGQWWVDNHDIHSASITGPGRTATVSSPASGWT